MSVVIKIELPNHEWADAFWGWYLDGGGDSGFFDTLSGQEITENGVTWSDWQRENWTIKHSDQPLVKE